MFCSLYSLSISFLIFVLLKIVVKDAANTMYKFEVNRWLAKEKDDGQIERELSLSKSENNTCMPY